jgi:5-methylcytosine-specific restriction enzyme A
MPQRPKTDCLEPGCTTAVDYGRCPQHREEHRALTSPRQDYGPDWPRISKRQLRAHPLCARCGARATETDHRIPLRFFPTLRAAHDPTNLQSLCSPCHKRKTATEDSTFAKRAKRHTPHPVVDIPTNA